MTHPESAHFSDDSLNTEAIFQGIVSTGEALLMKRAVSDPRIEAVQAEARQYNTILAEEGRVSVDESLSIQQQLDVQWDSLNEQDVRVTGKVFVQKDEELVSYVVTEATMASRGFTVRGTYSEEDGEAYLQNPRVYHAFKVGRAVLDTARTGKGASKKTWAYASIEDVLIEPEIESGEHAAAWLESNNPELFEEINQRVFNAEGDESDSLLALKGLNLVDFAPIDDDTTRKYLQTYLQDIIDLDHVIFYSLGIEGAFEVKYKNTESAEELSDLLKEGVLAYVYGPYIDCEIAEGAPDRWSIISEFAIATPKKNESTVVIRASIDSVKNLMSLRRAYYGS